MLVPRPAPGRPVLENLTKQARASLQDATSGVGSLYGYLTQLAGLYAVAGEQEVSPVEREALVGVARSLLDDVGEVFLIWEAVHGGRGSRATGQPSSDASAEAALCRRVHSASKRLGYVLGRTNAWTSARRSLSALHSAEGKWRRLVGAAEPVFPQHLARLRPLATRSAARQATLAGTLARRHAEAQAVNAQFTAKPAA